MAARKVTKKVHIEDSLGRSYDREQLVNAPDSLESVPTLTLPQVIDQSALTTALPATAHTIDTRYATFQAKEAAPSAESSPLAIAFGERNKAMEEIARLEQTLEECDRRLADIRAKSPKEKLYKTVQMLEHNSAEVLQKIEEEAKRLYLESGVGAREAERLSKGIVERATSRQSQSGTFRLTELSPVRFATTKRIPETAAAAKAARTDHAYRALKKRANMIAEEWHEASQRASKASLQEWNESQPLQAEKDRALLLLSTDARKSLQKAYEKVEKASARMKAGISNEAVEHTLDYRFREDPANPTLVRNPDGTTNVWVWHPGEPGEPGDQMYNGRYERVIGVATTFSTTGERVNTLITALGEEVKAGEHYSNGKRKWASFDLLVEEPKPGAEALASEGNPSGGWFASTDSSG